MEKDEQFINLVNTYIELMVSKGYDGKILVDFVNDTNALAGGSGNVLKWNPGEFEQELYKDKVQGANQTTSELLSCDDDMVMETIIDISKRLFKATKSIKRIDEALLDLEDRIELLEEY